MHNYKQLKIWQKARALVKEIYVLSANFPDEERFNLTSQLRRASVSIVLNIAEGSGFSDKKFQQFLRTAISSCFEVETVLLLALDLELISEETFSEHENKLSELQKMIFGFMKSLNVNKK